MQNRTPYQDRIVRNYYQNQDAIQTQRLGELVTDLYLAEGKKRAAAWKKITSALERLKIPASRIDHLVKSDNPALVADLLQELLSKK